MSARGHRPRTTADDQRVFVGGVNHHIAVGVGDYTVRSTRDPFDTVWFDSNLEDWIAAGAASMSTRQVVELREERRLAS